MAYFANNPIIATVTCGNFPEGATNKRIKLTVTIGSATYPFYHAAESGQSYTIDVRSAYRAELLRKGFPTPTSPSSATVTGTCSVVGQYMNNGLVGEMSAGFSVSGGNVTARHGGYSEVDRRNGTAEAPAILSTKPMIPERVAVGEKVMLGGSIITAVKGAQTFAGRVVYGEEDNYRHTMYFLNRYGEIETASILSLEALSVNPQSETVSQVHQVSASSYNKKRIYKTGDNNKWKMSSGYLDRDWLQWFAHDFIMSEHHWINTKQGILPCNISASEMDIYDRSSGELKAVNFTVECGLEGVVEL